MLKENISRKDASVAAGQYIKEKKFWLDNLSGDLVKSTFPYDYYKKKSAANPPGENERRLESEESRISGELFSRLMRLSNNSNVRLHIILLAGIVVLLDKYTGNNDITVGVPIYKQRIEGKFVNTVLALRNKLEENITFKELLLQLRQTIGSANENLNYPVETLLYQLNIPFSRDDDFPLFDIGILLENVHHRHYFQDINLNMIFNFFRTDECINVYIEYNSLLYKETTIQRIMAHLKNFLAGVLPDRLNLSIEEIDILSEQERRQILVDFNQTAQEYPKDKTIHRLFEEQVEKTPHHTAVAGTSVTAMEITREPGPDKDIHYISYKELDKKAHGLTAQLRRVGAKPGMIVAIMMERTVEIIIAILGVLKAGGAYLPINPELPQNRIISMLEESQVLSLITQTGLFETYEMVLKEKAGLALIQKEPGEMQETAGQVILTRQHNDTQQQAKDPAPIYHSSDLAYVIFTSGSTGRPKGTMMEHESVNNLVYGLKSKIYKHYSGHLKVSIVAPFEFDASVQQIFGALLQGHALYIIPEDTRIDGAGLLEFYRKYNINISDGTPTHIRLQLENIEGEIYLPFIKHFIIAGEVLPQEIAAGFLQCFRENIPRISNLYGPTETCVDSTFYHISPAALEMLHTIPIGKPLPNQQVYIVDKENQLQPIGVVGELYIGGDGLARGYLNNPELTAEKFLTGLYRSNRSYKSYIPGKIYKTGDLARWLADGDIEFLGRIDHQVKIRGFRIELGEIESQLRAHESIKDAVVVPIEDEQGDRSLCAYYVEKTSEGIECWPSVGEYFVWDDLLYYAMTNDKPRNRSYKVAIDKLVRDKTVVEIGTGPDAILARFCAEAGVNKVYAIEILEESYKKARDTVRRLNLEEKITVIHGDATAVQLPEKVDVCLSQIIGNIASSEGAIHILNNASRFLKENGVMIPGKCETKIAAVQLPEDVHENPGFSEISKIYPDKIFKALGYKFDFRVCVKNFPQSAVISNLETFENLDFSGIIPLENTQKVNFTIRGNARIDGFLLWINLYTMEDELIDTSENKYVWSPVFIPVFYPGVDVSTGDIIRAECIRNVSNNNICPDYKIKGVLIFKNGENLQFEYDFPYQVRAYRKNPFYQTLFKDGSINVLENRQAGMSVSELKEYLQRELPDHMIPTYFVQLEEVPLAHNGKVDRKALPRPEPVVEGDYAAARHELDKKIIEIWSEVLGIEKDIIGIDSDFFRMGGHSLKATRLVTKLHKELNVKLPLVEIFAKATVRGLSDYLAGVTRDRCVSITAVEAKEYYPASSAQKRLYVLHQVSRENTSYNMPTMVTLEGNIEKDRFETIFRNLIQRHEIFRTSFEIIEGKPVQRVHGAVEFAIEYHDPRQDEQPREIIDHFIKPFDLSRAPLMRVGLLDTKEGNILMLDMHHIISDGTSSDIFVKEFTALYNGEDLPSLRVQYKDYSGWQNSEEQTKIIKRQEQYWQKKFEVEPPILTLPVDYVRPTLQDFQGSTRGFTVAPEETAQLKTLALKEETTMFMVLLAIFNVLLAKVSGQQDIVVGTGIEGRSHEDLHQVVGMFVNTLALRSHPQPGISFLEFLKQVKKITLEAFENQGYQFETLVEQIIARRDTSRNPLFDIMFQLDNLEHQGLANLGSSLKPYPYQKRISKFDMTLFAKEAGKQLFFSIEYSTALFKEETIQWFATFFKEILKTVTRNPAGKLVEIIEIPEERKKTLLEQLNQEFNREVNIIKKNSRALQIKWEKHINTCKDKIAIQMGTRAVTYDELDRRANHMANWMIHNRAIAKGTFIGILMDDRLELIVTVMGILKARAVMVPLDPDYPEDRLRLMLNSTDVNYIIADNVNINRFLAADVFNTPGREFIPVEKLFSPPASSWLTEPPGIRRQAEDSIYIYFTSGSTGIPRAMIGKNSGLVHFIDWEIDTFNLHDTSRITQLTTPAFDAFLRDVFVPLLSGGVVCIPGNKDILLEADKLIKWIDQADINGIHCVPTIFRLLTGSLRLNPGNFKNLKFILFSGEKLEPADLVRWYETFHHRIQLVNLWGTSETTLAKTSYFIRESDINRARIPVGKPMKGARVIIMDENMNLCDYFVPGKLYIRTPFATRGYYNDPRLNKQKFIPCPFSGNPGDLLHDTGDRGKFLPDGNIDLLGRNDRQVKIQGIRIELEEIESVLSKHPRVKEAAAVKREIPGNNDLLYVFITGNETGKPVKAVSPSNLKEYLSQKLPGYMVPAEIIKLEEIPRNPNGKIDYQALPDPLARHEQGYILPQNDIQKRILELWRRILGIEKISIDKIFFELGGNSLKIMSLISKIHKEFDVRISLGDIFSNPTIEQQAEIIKEAKGDKYASIGLVEEKEYYEPSSAQKRIYFLYRMEPGGIVYNMPIIMGLERLVDKKRMKDTFRKLIRRHESFRTSFEMLEGKPVQRIHREVPFGIDYFEAGEEEVNQLIERYIRPFDLSQVPLLRVGLIKSGEKRHLLMVDIHHIISDGVSLDILKQDFFALSAGKVLQPLRIQYKDFTDWQNRDREKENRKQQEAYWLNQYEGEIPVLNLPTDYPRPVIQNFEGNMVSFVLETAETRSLKEIADQEGATLFMVLLAITNIFFSKISNQEDIVIGTPIAGRRHANLEKIIGMFVNNLALRNYPIGEKIFPAFLNHLKKRTLEAFENQEYQFEDLVEKLAVNRDAGRNPLFDVVFTLRQVDGDVENILKKDRTDWERHQDAWEKETSKFDITLHGLESGPYLFLTFLYSIKLFKKETIQRFIAYFKKIVSLIVKNRTLKLGQIEIISEQEKRQVLFDFNHTRAKYHYPRHKTTPGLFAEQVKRTSDKIALVGGGQLAAKKKERTWEPVQITYRELNERSTQLAGLLRHKGIMPDTIVGIIVERSAEMIIGIMGILKSGAGYLPIDPQTPLKRIRSMLRDSGSSFLVTHGAVLKHRLFTMLQDYRHSTATSVVTVPRTQVTDLDGLPFPDRSLVDYEAYSRYIGQAMVKNSISMQATRGCPFSCAYCHKIWPKNHVFRSAENIFAEVQLYYNMGIRRFAFIDDIFNLNIKNSERFFRLIIENRLDVQLFFPNGVRGDILTKAYIDLMVEAGTVNLALALETASPRLQESIGKRLNLQKLYENIAYIWEKYPQVISELFTIHGFPSETKEEAEKTLDFIKRLKWVHFPYVFVLKIYPHTEMARIALENGIPGEAIAASEGLAYHELPETLPFEKSFTIEYQAKFLKEYFLSKERLLEVLPYQMNILSEDEMVQKYNSYLPTKITRLDDLLTLVGITRAEFAAHTAAGYSRARVMMPVPDLNRKLERYFKKEKKEYTGNAFNVLLLDMSQFFSSDSGDMLYEVMEPPLGLMYLATYLNRQMGGQVNCKAAKSRIDFDSFEQLKTLLEESKPDLIGIRTLTFFRDFFHRAVGLIRQWGFEVPIIAGGPYATSDYTRLLSDGNIDVAVLGEGEVTFCQLVEAIIVHKGQLPPRDILEKIPGIAFVPEEPGGTQRFATGIIQLDMLPKPTREPTFETPVPAPRPGNLAYTIFTSGSTGTPKGVMVEHQSLLNLVYGMKERVFPAKDSLNLNVSLLSPYVFDASVKQVFPTLLSGHKLVVVPEDVRLNGKELVKFYNHQDIRVSDGTPVHLRILLDEGSLLDKNFPVEQFLIGGEELEQGTCKKLLEVIGGIGPRGCKREIINVYGPTEATDVTTLYHVPPPVKPTEAEEDRPAARGMPIGKPLPHIHTCILDRFLNPQPVMIAGELHIGGRALARGYLNNPGLTAEKFIEIEVKAKVEVEGETTNTNTLYKTGDLCRWLPDGNIEFSGRIDSQIKLRGYRIEIGEIENQLLTHPGVKQAVILARTNQDGENDKLLFAYVVPTEGRTPGNTPALVSELKKYLSHSLPAYMIPSFVIPIEKIPLTANGKVDRETLFKSAITTRSAYKTPRNEIERKLLEVWSEVLGRGTSIGIDDNFFELGGHSLKAIILLSKVHKELHVEIPLAQVFITPDIRGLAGYIKKSVKHRYVSIEPVEKKDYYPLSSAQKRLYMLQYLELESIGYNIPNFYLLAQEPGIRKLEDTFRKLIDRHESLRTSFEVVEEKPVQSIHRQVPFEVEYYDLPANSQVKITKPQSPGQGQTRALVDSIINQFLRSFDLTQAPLLRVGLIKENQGKTILMVDMHHIISDRISHTILVNDYISLYLGKDLPGLPLQYKDYSQWRSLQKEKEIVKQQEEFWLKEFAGEIPVLDLPGDYTRPVVQSFEGSTVVFQVGKDAAAQFKKLLQQEGVTMFMGLLAVFNVFLFKIGSQEDIVTGTPVAGRRHADLEQVIGMFVNTLALRNFPSGEKNFKEFLKEVKKRTLDALENQEFPFEDLVDKLQVKRDVSRNPLFDVMFTYEKIDANLNRNEITGTASKSSLKSYDFDIRVSKFDMILFALELNEKLCFSIDYCTKLFKKETIERFIRLFNTIFASLLADPGQKISAIDMMGKEEKNLILHDFNRTTAEYPRHKTVDELFVEQVHKNPTKIAVSREDHSITYNELDNRSGTLAALLRSKGVHHEAVVGVMMENTVERITGLIAVLEAGGAYLPIDRQYPEERKKIMMKDGSVGILLADEKAPVNSEIQIINPGDPMIYANKKENPREKDHRFNSLVYIIYTSGSTGIPKGVMVQHRCVVRLVKNTNFITFDNNERILQTGALEFDASTFEIWGSLLNGLVLHLAAKEKILDANVFKDIITRCKISTIWLTSSLFNQFVEVDIDIFSGLKNLLVGGEALSPLHINRIKTKFPGLKVINGYGPTENTTFSTTYTIDKEYNQRIPIGKPINNSNAFILSDYDNSQPIGVSGELCVGGDGVARGYLNDVSLTAQRFTMNPEAAGERIYRTGDQARWKPDGNIDFLGRFDFQVKIRGFRVELEEIENQLLSHEKIKEAAALVRKTDGKHLYAYIVPLVSQPDSTREFDISKLKAHLSKQLPAYMIPDYFILLEKMPLTKNGKLDRKILSEMDAKIAANVEYIAPRTNLEKIIAESWKQVLKLPKVGMNDNFFDIGGNSFNIITLSFNLKKLLRKDISIAKIFQYPTIALFAKYLDTGKDDNMENISKKEDHSQVQLENVKNRIKQKRKRRR